MNKTIGLIRSHPYLLVFSIIVLIIFGFPEFMVQGLPKRGWTTYLEGSVLSFNSHIVIDDQDRIWVSACAETSTGLYLFNGSEWITLPGSYCDLARGPDGRIWAVAMNGNSVTVFDGKQKTTLTSSDLGIDTGDEIRRIEIDPSGGLWMTLHLKNIDASISPAENQLVRIVLEEGKQPVVTRYPELLPYEGVFTSLDADSQGRVWAGVKKSISVEVSSGFYMFNGKEWLPVQLPQSETHEIVQTTLDKEGNAWLATGCGDIYKQTSNGWERVIEGFGHPRNIPSCWHSDTNTRGIIFNNHGRLWAWGHNMVRYLDGDQWITFTQDNSGVGGSVSGVVFDKQDRIWVDSSRDGVRMTTAENLQPLPKILKDIREFVQEHYTGGYLFIPIMIVLLWLAADRGMLPGVLLAFVAGLAVTVMWVMYFGIFVGIFGAIGGFIGGNKDKQSGVPIRRWVNMNLILAIVGSILGLGIGYISALFLFTT